MRPDESGISSQLETNMDATPIAEAPVIDTGAVHIERTQKALEFMRVQAVLEELRALGSTNKRLIAWHQGRMEVLAAELEIRPRGRLG